MHAGNRGETFSSLDSVNVSATCAIKKKKESKKMNLYKVMHSGAQDFSEIDESNC